MVPAAPAQATTIPVNGSLDPTSPPGELDYSVLVGYGTPEQQFPVFLDTVSGRSQLWCKPCASGSNDCEPAFDPSRSSTFTHVPCGSPDCPVNNCNGSLCQLVDPYMDTIIGTFSNDVLTLAPSSMAVQNFTFVCLDLKRPADELPEAGTLDLSRDRNSLPSRLSSSSPAFSYCLPHSTSALGFLSLGGTTTTVVGEDNRTVHAPLVNNEGDPKLANKYFIDLVGMSFDGEDLPILADAFGAHGTLLDVGTTFTLLPPAAYTPLRDAFRAKLSDCNCSLPGTFAGFDTCYHFLGFFPLPVVQFHFGNGESLEIGVDQILYFNDTAGGAVVCLAFSSMDTGDDDGASFSVMGTYQLASTEVVYDVAGGQVGFIPGSC